MLARMKPAAALVALALALAPSFGAATPPEAPPATAAIAQGNRRFALALYREIAREEHGNIFFSPASIAFALGPLSAGARGETRAGIARALSFPTSSEELHPALAALQRGLERDGQAATISIANAIWLERSFVPRPAFLDIARSHYRAAVETLDFGGNPDGAAARINHWADVETHGRIPHVVDRDMFGPATRMVVTNAVYFLADWADRFPAQSSPAPFTAANGQRADVPMMRQTLGYRHYDGPGFAALDLPYRDQRLAMTVLLPDDARGLPDLERALTPALLERALRALDRAAPVDVDVALPRLNLRRSYSLNNPLGRLGMGLAFTPRADFGGLSETPAQISGVSQYTFLRVDERGTEAAAVTVVDAIVITGTRRRNRPIVFHADHPFLFMLRDRESGAILFFGRIVRPE
jgi:serpin B